MSDGSGAPAYIHMFSVGRTKIKMYEGGYMEISVSGREKSSTITVDNDGNVFIDNDGTLQVSSENVKFIT